MGTVRLRQVHRWIGVVIALPIAVQGLTGAILAFTALIPERRFTMAPPKAANEIVAAAERQAGIGSHATRYFVPASIGYAARVEIAAAGTTPKVVRIDPATLAILSVKPAGSELLDLVRAVHVHFAIETGGRLMAGWVGVGLLIMLVTGVPIWWPRNGRIKHAFSPDFRARELKFHHRLHGATGGWIVAVLGVLTVTGIALAFPGTTRDVLGLEQRGGARAPTSTTQAASPSVDIDRDLELARQAEAYAIPRMVALPTGPGGAVRVMLNHPGESGAVSAIQVQVDTKAGMVTSIDSAATRSSAETFYRWLHDIHTDSGIGVWWDVAEVVAGLCLPLLAVTGVTMWWRLRRGLRSTARYRRPGRDPSELTTD